MIPYLLTISSKNPRIVIDAILKYTKDSYVLSTLSYKVGWFSVTYTATLRFFDSQGQIFLSPVVSDKQRSFERTRTMSLILTDMQKVDLSVTPVNPAGNPAPVGNATWASSDESVLVIAHLDDPLKVTAVTTGKLGVSKVTFTCDTVVGEGTVPLTADLDIEVIASPIESVHIDAGTPTEK